MPVAWKVRGGIIAGSAIALVVFLVQQGTGGYSLFTLHPLLMMVAFLLCMGEGVVHYKVSEAELSVARRQHRNIFMLSGVLSLAAVYIILQNKINVGHEMTPHTAHAICGVLTMCMVFFQGSIGMRKLQALVRSNGQVKKLRWHGAFGIMTFGMSSITMILGFREVVGSDSYSMAFAGLSIVAVFAIVLHTHMKRERTVTDDSAYGVVRPDEIDDIRFETEPSDYA